MKSSLSLKASMPNGQDLRRLTALIKEFAAVQDGRDRRWTFMLREGRRWTRLQVTEYDGTFYFSGSNFDSFSHPATGDLDPTIAERLRAWLRELALWKKDAARDPIGAQGRLFRRLPLSERTGVMQRKNVRWFLPSWMPLASELGGGERKDILEVLEHPPAEGMDSMTLRRFLDYCRAAYRANPRTFRDRGYHPGLSGRACYEKYADGRHGGLLDLPADSARAFQEWHESKAWSGCHPWEIYRGGNSTHVDMYVSRRADRRRGWEVHLSARSSARLIETCRIARCLAKARMPVFVDDAQSYVNRLLDQDWVGIVPREDEIAYGWQSFPQEWGVRDCVRLDWFFEESAMGKKLLNRRLGRLIHCLPEHITAFLKTAAAPVRT